MKKLLLVIVPILLVWYGYNEYMRYKRFHPPSSYDYAVNDSIDVNYYDAAKVLQYYQAAEEVGNIARNAWFEHQIDVRFHKKEEVEVKPYVQRYQQAVATAKMFEKQLIQASKLKKMGLKNEDIRLITENGSIENAAQAILKNGVLKREDTGMTVFRVQEMLKKKGFDLPVDGYFEQKTETAVRSFQAQKGLYVTGKVDDLTLAMLMK